MIGHDDGVGRRFEKIAELRLDQFGVAQNLDMRNIFLRDEDEFRVSLGVVDGLVRNDGVDERAVLAKPRRFKGREAGGERFAPELIEVIDMPVAERSAHRSSCRARPRPNNQTGVQRRCSSTRFRRLAW